MSLPRSANVKTHPDREVKSSVRLHGHMARTVQSGGVVYTPSLDFSDSRNSMYLGVIT